MNDFTKDMATWYPLIPKPVADNKDTYMDIANALSYIRGLKIFYTVPADRCMNTSAGLFPQAGFYAYLENLSTAKLHLQSVLISPTQTLFVGDTYDIPLQLCSTKDTIPTSGSYIILEDGAPVSEMNNIFGRSIYYIHPDCIEIYQEAPMLNIYGYQDTDESGMSDTLCNVEIGSSSNSVIVKDGYNCENGINSGSGLSFTAGAGLGLGIVQDPEDAYTLKNKEALFIDPDTKMLMNPAGKGLRSIHGFSDDVLIKGFGDVVLSTSTDERNGGIQITIGERPHAGGTTV